MNLATEQVKLTEPESVKKTNPDLSNLIKYEKSKLDFQTALNNPQFEFVSTKVFPSSSLHDQRNYLVN
jgi:hypothetical protein